MVYRTGCPTRSAHPVPTGGNHLSKTPPHGHYSDSYIMYCTNWPIQHLNIDNKRCMAHGQVKKKKREKYFSPSLSVYVYIYTTRLLVSAAGGLKWGRPCYRMIGHERCVTVRQFTRALGRSSTRSGPVIPAAGRLRVAKIPHKMALPVESNFTARGL